MPLGRPASHKLPPCADDKLLTILSEGSIASLSVISEAGASFDGERREHRLVLLGLNRDDAIMRTDEVWAADIRRRRHIGDFTRWNDHDFFERAFQRLLRGLKQSAG
jgi:hypothetical protein